MFSGIVEELGTVRLLKKKKNAAALTVSAKKVVKGIKPGASVAVNGACLTVTKRTGSSLTFDVIRETLDKTSLGQLKKGSRVNLERSLKSSDRIDGHFVTGHIDNVVPIRAKIEKANDTELWLGMKRDLAKFIVAKGSVCVDGVSLTVGKATKKYFTVYLIPFTKHLTTLGLKGTGDLVNIETDILAKYILNKRN